MTILGIFGKHLMMNGNGMYQYIIITQLSNSYHDCNMTIIIFVPHLVYIPNLGQLSQIFGDRKIDTYLCSTIATDKYFYQKVFNDKKSLNINNKNEFKTFCFNSRSIVICMY